MSAYPLHAECKNGSASGVLRELNKNADINQPDPDTSSNTPLYTAIHSKKPEIVQLLIDRGADVNKANANGWTPLHIACHTGQPQVVKMLLDTEKVNVCVKALDGNIPLHTLVSNKKIDAYETATLLVNYDSNVCHQVNNDNKTAVHLICTKKNNVETLQLLINKGADVNAQDKNGRTPLHVAGSLGFVDLCKWLLDHGADKDKKNNDGQDVLAASTDHPAIVQLLESTPVNKPRYISPIRPPPQPQIVTTAIPRKDLEALVTPLYSACESGNYGAAAQLISNGALVNAPLANGFTPLHIASELCHEKIVELLLDQGADTSLRDNKGRTAQDLAKTERVKFLLAELAVHNADIFDYVRHVKQHRKVVSGTLPDPSLQQVLEKLRQIDPSQVKSPGLDELTIVESNLLLLKQAQEQLRLAGREASQTDIRQRNILRCKLGEAIVNLEKVVNSSKAAETLELQRQWCEMLGEQPNQECELDDFRITRANAISAATKWIEDSDNEIRHAVNDTNQAINGLAVLHDEASQFLRNTSRSSTFDPTAFRTDAAKVRQALRQETSAHIKVATIPQEIIDQLQLAALFTHRQLCRVISEFKAVKDATARHSSWATRTQPWLTQDAHPTAFIEKIKEILSRIDDLRSEVEGAQAKYNAEKRKKLSTETTWKNLTDSQKNLADAMNALRQAQFDTVHVLDEHFPELLEDELISEFARLDGLKLSNASVKDFATTEVTSASARHKVLKAVDALNNVTALKEYRMGNAQDSKARQADFEKEVRILHRLNHPTITTVLSFFFEDNAFYLQMPWYDLGSLDEWANKNPPPPQSDIQLVLRKVLQAIDYIHSNRVIHGDIKPQNIMLKTSTRSDGMDAEPVLVDFDLAKELDTLSTLALTAPAGTRGYIAPEMFEGQGRSFASDMYAFGVTIAHINFPPQSCQETKAIPVRLPAHANPSLRLLVNKLISVNPKDRPTARDTLLDAYFSSNLNDIYSDRRRLPLYWSTSVEDRADRILDVSTLMSSHIDSLLKKTCANPFEISVTKVEIIEDSARWLAYSGHKISITHSRSVPITKEAQVELDVLTSEFAETRPGGMDKAFVNEIYALQSVSAEKLRVIKTAGMDERMIVNSICGDGFYFTDKWQDGPEGGEHYMILARVSLGKTYETQTNLPRTSRRPPCVESCPTDECTHHRFDSVHYQRGTDNQFVVYNHNQIYTEYIITYTKTP